jgi:hypothetical protein
MTEILYRGLDSLNFDGIIVGTGTILSIWITRYICIKGEYYFTKKFWVVFLVLGIASIAYAASEKNLVISTIFSIFGFSNLWGIHEVIEQEERVKKGWFPRRNKP